MRRASCNTLSRRAKPQILLTMTGATLQRGPSIPFASATTTSRPGLPADQSCSASGETMSRVSWLRFEQVSQSGATTVTWETCAPGHGKGPWDGIGAVIKRFLRLLEKNTQVYANGARDVFCALLDHFRKEKVGSKVTIAEFVFHYILSAKEQPLPNRANVWSPVSPLCSVHRDSDQRHPQYVLLPRRRRRHLSCANCLAGVLAAWDIGGPNAKAWTLATGRTWS